MWWWLACTSPSDEAPADAPTFHEDVAPILADSCTNCHQDGAIAPMPLTTYDEASAFSEVIAADAAARIMPPFLADNAGACNTFEHANWLSDEEIATLEAWAEAEAPEGDPSATPAEMTPPIEGLSDWTHDASMAETYAPDFGGAADDYRCFLVDPGLDDDAYLTAYEVRPGDATIVHHLVAYGLYDQAGFDEATALDEADPGPGYTCFGDAGVDSTFLIAAWAPGGAAWEYPEGTGIPLDGDLPLIVQMHYNDGGGVEDQTAFRLRMADVVERPLSAFFWVNSDLNIPPGVDGHKETDRTSLASYTGYPADLIPTQEILAIAPHMHQMGKSLKATMFREDGSKQCVVDVPRWDFNWQFVYTYTQPIEFNALDELKLDCIYDSSEATETVNWGEGTGAEMCLVALFTADKL